MTYRVELNRPWAANAKCPAPLGWGVVSSHRSLGAARAEMERRMRQEGRGFEHRITDQSGKEY